MRKFLYSEVNVRSERGRGYILRSGAAVTQPEGERLTAGTLPNLQGFRWKPPSRGRRSLYPTPLSSLFPPLASCLLLPALHTRKHANTQTHACLSCFVSSLIVQNAHGSRSCPRSFRLFSRFSSFSSKTFRSMLSFTRSKTSSAPKPSACAENTF